MLVIRTAEEMARALDSPLETELKQILAAHLQRLCEFDGFDLSELAEFGILEPGDTLQDLSGIIGIEIGDGGAAHQFATIPEYVEQHDYLTELVFILSDFGNGLVLLIPTIQTIDPAIRALAKSYVDEPASS